MRRGGAGERARLPSDVRCDCCDSVFWSGAVDVVDVRRFSSRDRFGCNGRWNSRRNAKMISSAFQARVRCLVSLATLAVWPTLFSLTSPSSLSPLPSPSPAFSLSLSLSLSLVAVQEQIICGRRRMGSQSRPCRPWARASASARAFGRRWTQSSARWPPWPSWPRAPGSPARGPARA